MKPIQCRGNKTLADVERLHQAAAVEHLLAVAVERHRVAVATLRRLQIPVDLIPAQLMWRLPLMVRYLQIPMVIH
jgi:hypothetical protein